MPWAWSGIVFLLLKRFLVMKKEVSNISSAGLPLMDHPCRSAHVSCAPFPSSGPSKRLCTSLPKRLTFDVDTMCIGLGPLRLPIPLKESKPIEQRDPKEQKGLPFFLYAYLDEDIIGEWHWCAQKVRWMAFCGRPHPALLHGAHIDNKLR
eukprot:1157661-Pelagomonas_calceolata.AAC.7